MKIYDKVKEILTNISITRDSDNELIWCVSDKFRDAVLYGTREEIKEEFMHIKFESYRRCRQKIQEENESLRGTKRVRDLRAKKQEMKGAFVYHEEIKEQLGLI